MMLPSTAHVFKPEVESEIAVLLEYCQNSGLLKLNDYNLLVEVKEYLQQTVVSWSIASNHVKLLCERILIVYIKLHRKIC